MTVVVKRGDRMLKRMNFAQFVNKARNKIIFFLQDSSSSYGYQKRIEEVKQFIANNGSLCPAQNGCIVSLTSYGERINTVHLAIASIMDQTVQPDQVVLYLDKDTCSDPLPPELLTLCDRGLRIVRNVENIRGHKKYFYAMQEYPDKTIVTIDDDVLYPRKALKQLITASKKYPKCVIARRVHRVIFDRQGKPLRYTDWLFAYRGLRRKSNDNILTGCGGTLFPPQSLPVGALNADAIRRCALSADDIWLSCALRSVNRVIYRAAAGVSLFWEIAGTQTSALNRENIDEGGNDKAMGLTMKYFGLASENFSNRRKR